MGLKGNLNEIEFVLPESKNQNLDLELALIMEFT